MEKRSISRREYGRARQLDFSLPPAAHTADLHARRGRESPRRAHVERISKPQIPSSARIKPWRPASHALPIAPPAAKWRVSARYSGRDQQSAMLSM